MKKMSKAGNGIRQFFHRRRKSILIAVLLIAAILGSWYAGRKLHPEGLLGRYAVQEKKAAETVEAADVSAETEEKDVHKGSGQEQEKSAVSFENSASTEDNPWGFTAGVIEMENEGDCFFLSPGTGVKVELEEGEYVFDCRLHPAVAEGSDGVSVRAELLDQEGNSLSAQEEMIHGADIVPIKVDREKWPEAGMVRMTCGNGENGNSDADWLVIKMRYRTPSTFAREDYVRSATYFGDAWPMNFWNSEMDHLQEDLSQIREDGFNSIILVISWKEFQPSLDPVEYSDYAFDQLDRVLKAAEEAGLKVYARVSYLWDLVNDQEEDVFDRASRVLYNPVTRGAWKEYVEKVFQRLSASGSFGGGFLTWEDYLKPFLRLCDSDSMQKRADDARMTGYQEWVRNHYTLEEYNAAFAVDYARYEAVLFPGREEPAMEALYAFFDDLLNGLLADGQTVFPNLSCEIRLDADLVRDRSGESKYITHEATYSCGSADYTAAMYGIPMGFENVGERVKAPEALEHTRSVLKRLNELNEGKPVYLEQFIFFDNTPQFDYNARLKEEEVDDYLLGAPEILLQYTGGYGVWTYRDYRDLMLFNSDFYLKGRGWETEGSVLFGEANGSSACMMTAPSAIRQKVPEIRDHFDAKTLRVSFEVSDCAGAAVVRLKAGDAEQVIRVGAKGVYQAEFPKTGSLDFSLILESGTLSIDRIRMYSHVQNGHLYDSENVPQEQLESIRKMNGMLEERYAITQKSR